MIGIFFDHTFNAIALDELAVFFVKVQGNNGAAVWLIDGFNGVFTTAIGYPAHPFGSVNTGPTSFNRNLIGNDKTGIKANPKLANQIGIGLAVFSFCKHFAEFGGARSSDSANIGHHLIAAHADTVVRNNDLIRFFVDIDPNDQIAIPLQQVTVLNRFKA